MKKMVMVKKKKGIHKVDQKMIDAMEMNLEEITAVRVAMFDPKYSRIDLEIEEGEELELAEVSRAVLKSGTHTVVSIV